MTKRTRMKPADRQAAILEAAIEAARMHGYRGFLMKHVADLADCSHALIVSYFHTMDDLRKAVMLLAIKREMLPIIATGIALRDKHVRRIPAELHARAVQSLGA